MRILKDFCGVLICIIVYTIIILIACGVIFLAIKPISDDGYFDFDLMNGIYLTFLALSLTSHFACMVTDPGTLNKQNTIEAYKNLLEEDNRDSVCTFCSAWKPPRAHHCMTCKSCILNMDHHCPWVNNCIGFYNQKHFLLFLIYTLIGIIISEGFLFCKVLANTMEGIERSRFEVFFLTFTIVAAGVFFLMISSILSDQIKAIKNNISSIDVLQHKNFIKRPLYTNLQEIFGGKLSPLWFIPTPISGKPKKVVERGYEASKNQDNS